MIKSEKLFALRRPSSSVGNCIQSSWPEVGLPGVTCWGTPNSCGRVWAALGERIRRTIGDDFFLRSSTLSPVTPPEFISIREKVINDLDLPVDTVIRPGTAIGYLEVDMMKACKTAFMWLPTSTIVISAEVRDLLVDRNYTGFSIEPVIIRRSNRGIEKVQLWELVVPVNGSLTVEPDILPEVCEVCGWTGYDWSKLSQIYVKDTIDSDFISFPPPLAGIVFVKAWVAEEITAAGFTNFSLTPIEEVISDILLRHNQS